MEITPDQARAELARRELIRRGQSETSGAPSFINRLGASMEPYSASQLGSPQQLLESIPPLLNRSAGKLGTLATEQLSTGQNRIDPYTAAGIGTAISMGPEVAMTLGMPIGEPEEASKTSIGMARRALGFQKGMLKTQFARSKAANAAKAALEEGIIPGSGSADVAFSRANEFKNAAGRKLGDLRESVGPQEIKPVFRKLDSLRNELTQGGATGGIWDLINDKIAFAKKTLWGLYESSNNSPTVEPPLPSPSSLASNSWSPPSRTAIGPVPTDQLIMRGQTLPSTEVMRDLPNLPQLEYWNKPPNFSKPSPDVIDAEIIPPETEKMKTKTINRLNLNSVEATKKRLAGGVNWLSDANTQSDAKGISNAIESGIEDILRSNGVPMDLYRATKNKYAAASSMVQGLNNELAGSQSRMIPSATGIVIGAGKLAAGDPMGAIRDIGLMELLRRRGAGIAATSAYKASETIPRAVAALRLLRKQKNENSAQ